ncbi:MAG: hypothetical protein EG825_05345 [Rhodocyclaceae bacterium]|nr:hypothetical protein [Rhodocyclaceae bacterium]
MSDVDELKEWDQMLPVGREWGAPHAEILWALDTLANRLQGTDLELFEIDGDWLLRLNGKELARWQVSATDWDALRAAVVAANDEKAISVWEFATTHATD